MKTFPSALRRCLLFGALAAGVSVHVHGQEGVEDKIFPYEYGLRDLDNGLRVFVVNTGFPNLVSLQTVVQVGSRNELEPGLTGFAHFFEHMMFRGTNNTSSEEFWEFYKEIGASINAYTTDDYTAYHATLPSEVHLERALMIEADRFKNLDYSEDVFKIEASAILGEYNFNYASNPIRTLYVVQRKIAYTVHPHKHNPMGFLDDIMDMPNQYEFSKVFFERFYRPANSMIVIAGDLDIEETSDMVEMHWGDWDRGEKYEQDIPEEPAGLGPFYEHIEWTAPTQPYITVAFHGPAFSETENDMATMDAAFYYAFGPSSAIYNKLVLTEQKASGIESIIPDHKDPYLLTVAASVYSAADLAYVQNEIMKTFASLRVEEIPAKPLADVVSYLRYSSANGMDSSKSIANSQVWYMSRTRDPETKNRVFQMYAQITTNDVMSHANKYFTDDRLVIVSLAGPGEPSPETELAFSVDAMVEEMILEPANMTSVSEEGPIDLANVTSMLDTGLLPANITSVLLPSNSPLVDFTFLFNVGSMNDPVGKEGLAKLTANMITKASSTSMSYEDIIEALFPMAAGLGNSVYKEITKIHGRVHVANLDKFYSMISTQLLHPAFNENDFLRIKAATITRIEDGIREDTGSLGSSFLDELIYTNHPYGHMNVGHVSAIKKLTLEDVRQFYKKMYTQANIVLGMAGGFSDEFVNRVKADLGSLPKGTSSDHVVTEPTEFSEARAVIVDRDIGKTSINFGFPIKVTRSHPDYAALTLTREYFGGGVSARLFWNIRELRGLNYGAYAYHASGGWRQFDTWRVYVTEVDTLERAHFATRCALYEFNKLTTEGISDKDFQATRQSLLNSINFWTATQRLELSAQLDDLYYGLEEDFTSYLRTELNELTLERVNEAIRMHLQDETITFLFVTSEAEALRDRLVNETTSVITYPSEPSAELLEEDQIIQDFKVGVKAENIDIVPVGSVFDGYWDADAGAMDNPIAPAEAPSNSTPSTEAADDVTIFGDEPSGDETSGAKSVVKLSKILSVVAYNVILIGSL